MSANSSTPVDTWISTVSGFFSVAANWSFGVPVNGGAIVVAPTSPIILTFDSGPSTLASATFQGATLVLKGAPLTITGGAVLTSVTLAGPHGLVLGGSSRVDRLTLQGKASLFSLGVVRQSGHDVILDTAGGRIVNTASGKWIYDDQSNLSHRIGGPGAFFNYGLLEALNVNAALSISARFVSTGTISIVPHGVLALTGNGATAQLSGAVEGGGLLEYGPSEWATLGAMSVTTTNQINWGIVDQVGTLTLNGAQTIENDGKWDLDGDISILVGPGANASNEIVSTQTGSTLAKTAGNGVSVVAASVNFGGGVSIASGTLEFTAAANAFTGPISGAGTFEIASGVTQFDPAFNTTETISVAHFLLSGGTAQILGQVTDTGAFEGDAGAKVALTNGTLLLAGTGNFAGVNIFGSVSNGSFAELIIAPTAKVVVSGAKLTGSALLFDAGVVTQTGGNVTLGADWIPGGSAASLTIAEGGVWNVTDASGLYLAPQSPGYFLVGAIGTAGLFEKSGTGVSVVTAGINNNSTNVVTSAGIQYEGIEVSSGTLDLQNGVGGTGTDNIVGGGTLEFDGYVSAGQTVSFFGSGGTLELTNPFNRALYNDTTFNGAIVGFDTTGSADTLLINAGHFRYMGAASTSTAAVLGFSDGSSSFSLTLTGDYTSGAFTAQTLNNGQIKITH